MVPMVARALLVRHRESTGQEPDARLVERKLSPMPIDGWREVVERSFREPAFRVPGGESGCETLERGWAAIRETLSTSDSLPVIVSHGQLLSLVLLDRSRIRALVPARLALSSRRREEN